MTHERGKHTERPPRVESPPDSDGGESPARGVPELLRRLLSVGFSGFFLTEEALRRAFGDTVPRDWVDFVSEQSERTRDEFLERLARELGETLDRVDLAALAEQLLASHSIEVRAEITLHPRGGAKEKKGGKPLEIKLSGRGRRR